MTSTKEKTSGQTHTKDYFFEDSEILELLKERENHVKKGKKLQEKIEKLQNDLNTIAHDVQKTKDKLVPLVHERMLPQIEMGEFDEMQTIDYKKDKVKISVVDRVEEYKEFYKNKKEEDKSKENE